MWTEGNNSCFAINTCRICASSSEVLMPIFGTVDDHKERIDHKIAKYLPIIVRKNDSKPKYICFSCISKLEVCRELHELSRASDFKFNNMLFSAALLTKEDAAGDNLSAIEAAESTDLAASSKQEPASPDPGALISLDSAFPEPLSPGDPVTEQDMVFMVELKYKDGDQNTVTKAHTVSYSIPQTSFKYSLPHLALSPSDVSPATKSPSATPLPESKPCPPPPPCLPSRQDSAGGARKAGDEAGKPPTLLFSPEARPPAPEPDTDASEKTAKSFPCSVCGKTYRRKTNLNAHMGSHTQVRPHACGVCAAAFSVRWELTLHQRLHSATFACAVCAKAFSVPSKLRRHERTHTGERPFACAQCGKSFGDKRNLAGHERTHSDERPFACGVCGRCFRASAHLKEHSRVHSKVAPFTCDVCGKRFKWKTNLNIHLKVHAGRRHACGECGREFSRSSDLCKHKRTHGGRTHSCAGCQRSYPDRAALGRHRAAPCRPPAQADRPA